MGSAWKRATRYFFLVLQKSIIDDISNTRILFTELGSNLQYAPTAYELSNQVFYLGKEMEKNGKTQRNEMNYQP